MLTNADYKPDCDTFYRVLPSVPNFLARGAMLCLL